jgi:hypothetical protein
LLLLLLLLLLLVSSLSSVYLFQPSQGPDSLWNLAIGTVCLQSMSVRRDCFADLITFDVKATSVKVLICLAPEYPEVTKLTLLVWLCEQTSIEPQQVTEGEAWPFCVTLVCGHYTHLEVMYSCPALSLSPQGHGISGWCVKNFSSIFLFFTQNFYYSVTQGDVNMDHILVLNLYLLSNSETLLS